MSLSKAGAFIRLTRPFFMSMLIALEFPDLAADSAFGKRTLVVRLGIPRAAWLHNALIIVAFICFGFFDRWGSLKPDSDG